MSFHLFRHDADDIVDSLEKATIHMELVLVFSGAHGKDTRSEQGHEGRMMGQNTHLAVVGRRIDRVGLAVKDGSFWRDDRDPHHALAIFLAFSTTSSIPPTM
jgi:hypothetical protein